MEYPKEQKKRAQNFLLMELAKQAPKNDSSPKTCPKILLGPLIYECWQPSLNKKREKICKPQVIIFGPPIKQACSQAPTPMCCFCSP